MHWRPGLKALNLKMMHKICLLLAGVLISGSANAGGAFMFDDDDATPAPRSRPRKSTPSPSPAPAREHTSGTGKELVIFIGGAGFSAERARKWAAAANAKDPSKEYIAIDFPLSVKGFGVKQEIILKEAGDQIARAKRLVANNSARKITLVGHSYGSAIADVVTKEAAALHQMKPGKDREVILEGFPPTSGFRNLDCWTTTSANAPNYKSMTGSCRGGRVHKHPAACEGKGCLHFSMVNNGQGSYDNYDLNLDWIGKGNQTAGPVRQRRADLPEAGGALR